MKMTSRGADIKNHKMRGEWAELRFMARAAEFGLRVIKPWGDSAHYDFAVEHKGHFLRVQVKSTTCKLGKSYVRNIRDSSGQTYAPNQLDFLAAYVVVPDVWYIIPAAVALQGYGGLCLSPHRKGHKYERYMEAWGLLKDKPSAHKRSPSPVPAGTDSDPVPEKNAETSRLDDLDPIESQDDDPPSLIESRLRAIKWNPILTHWKPRR
jgi:hypothetical protein